jgi:hypothetical protein
MALVRFSDLASAASLTGDAQSLAGQDAFLHAVFGDLTVPRDPDWAKRKNYVSQVFNDTAENRRAAALFAAAAIEHPVVILSDIDGSAAPFSMKASESRLVPTYKSSMLRLANAGDGSKAIFITGRKEEHARAILTNPDAAIYDSEGRVLLPEGSRKLAFPVICSHGSLYIPPDSEQGMPQETVPYPMTRAEKAFVHELHQFADGVSRANMAEVSSGKMDIQIKHSGIDIRRTIGELAPDMLKKMAALHDPRLNPEGAFKMHAESKYEVSSRFEKANKAKAAQYFVIDPAQKDAAVQPALYVAVVDSVGDGGTDREFAEFVQKSLGGVVLFVQNDRPDCMPTNGFTPDICLPSPKAAAGLLKTVANGKDARKGAAALQKRSM